MQPQQMQDPRLAIEGQKLQLQTQQMQQDAQMEQAKLQIDQQQTQADMQLEAAKLQQDAQEMQVRVQLEVQKQQAEDARKAAELQARIAMNTDDNRTAMELAAAEIASGERVAVTTGTGINPNPNS
jgi:thioredoxin-like negative regulator of GroEL